MFYAVFTKEGPFAQQRITESIRWEFDLREYTPDEIEQAKQEGSKFAHLFEEKEDEYGCTYYEFVTSEIL